MTVSITWYTTQIDPMTHVEKTTLVRISERIKDRNGSDLKSHTLKHIVESNNFSNNSMKHKIVKLLLIKEKPPTLNTHSKSVPFKLFN